MPRSASTALGRCVANGIPDADQAEQTVGVRDENSGGAFAFPITRTRTRSLVDGDVTRDELRVAQANR